MLNSADVFIHHSRHAGTVTEYRDAILTKASTVMARYTRHKAKNRSFLHLPKPIPEGLNRDHRQAISVWTTSVKSQVPHITKVKQVEQSAQLN